MALTWTPKQAATGALLVLAFPNSPLVIETVKRDPEMRPLLDHLIDRRIRWHFIEISSDEVIAIARAYDAAGEHHLAEMWLHGLSGETVELFEPAIPAPTLTEPDMRALLAYLTGHPWTEKYLERWDAVREELRALLDDPYIRMAAMPRSSRLAMMGLPADAADSAVWQRSARGGRSRRGAATVGGRERPDPIGGPLDLSNWRTPGVGSRP